MTSDAKVIGLNIRKEATSRSPKLGLLPRPEFRPRDPHVRRALGLMGPLASQAGTAHFLSAFREALGR